MSLAGRPSQHRDALLPILGPLDGAHIPGGCDSCDAYQEVEQMQPRAWIIHVRHDDDCPELAARRGEA